MMYMAEYKLVTDAKFASEAIALVRKKHQKHIRMKAGYSVPSGSSLPPGRNDPSSTPSRGDKRCRVNGRFCELWSRRPSKLRLHPMACQPFFNTGVGGLLEMDQSLEKVGERKHNESI